MFIQNQLPTAYPSPFEKITMVVFLSINNQDDKDNPYKKDELLASIKMSFIYNLLTFEK